MEADGVRAGTRNYRLHPHFLPLDAYKLPYRHHQDSKQLTRFRPLRHQVSFNTSFKRSDFLSTVRAVTQMLVKRRSLRVIKKIAHIIYVGCFVVFAGRHWRIPNLRFHFLPIRVEEEFAISSLLDAGEP